MSFAFFGTSKFAVFVLESLKTEGLMPSFIISTADKPKNRGLKTEATPVKKWAEENKIAVSQPEKLKSPEFIRTLLDTRCPTAIVSAYGKIIPKEVLDIFPKGILNVHPSLLPAWRGANPIRSSILAGDIKTGTTIVLMDEEVDHGPILAEQELKYPINNIQYSTLENKLAELGGKMLVETIPKWLAGEIKPQEQDHSKATYTKKITKEDGRINWSEPAEMIERKIRALNPWPGTFAFWNEKRVKILEGKELGNELGNGVSKSDPTPGKVFKRNTGFGVFCAKSALLIEKAQLEGKNPQNAKEFLNGHPDIIGSVLN